MNSILTKNALYLLSYEGSRANLTLWSDSGRVISEPPEGLCQLIYSQPLLSTWVNRPCHLLGAPFSCSFEIEPDLFSQTQSRMCNEADDENRNS